MSGKLILLVEDSKKVQNYNRSMLTDEGFTVETAITLADTRAFLAAYKADAIILDIGMPDGNGLDFLRELRESGSKTPVLLLTGYGEAKDIVLGFQTGCDDYLPKPYTFAVLLARLRRLLQSVEQVPETVTRGLLTLKLTPMEAYVNGVVLGLTPKDFSLLQFFIQNENRVLTADYVYEKVWGQPMAGDSRAFGNAVSRLRKKLVGCGYTISAEYGNGYRFERGEA
jgi:DNA-binding response OmpR family regulator